MGKRDVYIAIMVASAKGQGLHLTADEVDALTFDDAIATRAQNSLTTEEFDQIYNDPDAWAKIKTHERDESGNGSTGGNE